MLGTFVAVLKLVSDCLIAFRFYPKATQNSYVMFGFNPKITTTFVFFGGFLFISISWIFYAPVG